MTVLMDCALLRKQLVFGNVPCSCVGLMWQADYFVINFRGTLKRRKGTEGTITSWRMFANSHIYHPTSSLDLRASRPG
jgi:hypothetical protein